MSLQFFLEINKVTQNWKNALTVTFNRKFTFAFSALALALALTHLALLTSLHGVSWQCYYLGCIVLSSARLRTSMQTQGVENAGLETDGPNRKICQVMHLIFLLYPSWLPSSNSLNRRAYECWPRGSGEHTHVLYFNAIFTPPDPTRQNYLVESCRVGDVNWTYEKAPFQHRV